MDNSKKYNLVLFDLDGTIIETAPDLSKVVNYILDKELNLPPIAIEQNRLFIGGGFKLMFEKALKHYNQDLTKLEYIIDKARTAFPEFNGKEATVYEGVIPALIWLRERNIKVGVLTNKVEKFAIPILAMKGISPYLDILVAGDTHTHAKPEPEVLKYCCEKVGTTPAQTILIGDSEFDVKTAKGAGALAVCVDYGYCETPVHQLGADVVISSIYHYITTKFV